MKFIQFRCFLDVNTCRTGGCSLKDQDLWEGILWRKPEKTSSYEEYKLYKVIGDKVGTRKLINECEVQGWGNPMFGRNERCRTGLTTVRLWTMGRWFSTSGSKALKQRVVQTASNIYTGWAQPRFRSHCLFQPQGENRGNANCVNLINLIT